MQTKLEDVIETAMSLPLESQMKLLELLQKNVIEQEAANSPISEEVARREQLDKQWYARVEVLYEAGKVEEADNLKCLLDIMTTCADADEPDLDVDAMYKERLNNVSREPLFN